MDPLTDWERQLLDNPVSSVSNGPRRPSRSQGGPVRTEYYINDDGVYDVRPASHKNRPSVQQSLAGMNDNLFRNKAKKYYSEYWIHDMEYFSPKMREMYRNAGYEDTDDIA